MAAVLAVDNLQFVDSAEMLAFFDKFHVELHHHGSLNSNLKLNFLKIYAK